MGILVHKLVQGLEHLRLGVKGCGRSGEYQPVHVNFISKLQFGNPSGCIVPGTWVLPPLI